MVVFQEFCAQPEVLPLSILVGALVPIEKLKDIVMYIL